MCILILQTLRAKLTFWNTLALGIAMSAFSAVILFELRSQENSEVDLELAQRGQFFAEFMKNWPEHRPENKRPAPSAQKERLQSRQNEHRKPETIPVDRELERMQWFRGPRFTGPHGEAVGPMGFPLWDAPAISASLSGRKHFSISGSRGERTRVFTLPVRRDGRMIGIVQVARELGDFDRMWATRFRIAAVLFPVALVVAGFGGMFLTSRALRPIHLVTLTAGQIGEEDLSRRLPVTGRDELAELSRTFNRMIERLEAAFMSRAQAYESLEGAYEQQKQFTSDASHELRTPLTRVKLATSAALGGSQSSEEYRDALRVADHAADSMTALIEQLLTLARADAGQLRPRADRVDLTDLIRDCGAILPVSPELSFELPEEPIWIAGDEAMLSRLFLNLFENASRHTPSNGRIVASASIEGATAIVCVEDTGEGIPREHLPYVFQRFYRVDASRTRQAGGTGLGLAICRSIAEAHGGIITLKSRIGQGTSATVALPLFNGSGG
jgi:two-component system OmpR family sensor kinase